MALEALNITVSDMATGLVSTLFERFAWLLTLIKAVGIFVIVYVIYLAVKAFRDIRMRSRIKKIDDKMMVIDKKLDILLEANPKVNFPEKIEEIVGKTKKSFWSRFVKNDQISEDKKSVKKSKKKVVIAKSVKKSKK